MKMDSLHIADMDDNKAIKTYKESNVTDFTVCSDEFYESEPKIKLNSAIDIRYDMA